jgi:hypothetical protein
MFPNQPAKPALGNRKHVRECKQDDLRANPERKIGKKRWNQSNPGIEFLACQFQKICGTIQADEPRVSSSPQLIQQIAAAACVIQNGPDAGKRKSDKLGDPTICTLVGSICGLAQPPPAEHVVVGIKPVTFCVPGLLLHVQRAYRRKSRSIRQNKKPNVKSGSGTYFVRDLRMLTLMQECNTLFSG